ncbi:AIR synthase-related protein [Myxococcota bacterium]|nr:AIR synthase-related protein [Myxococcota bacterium]
MGSYAAAGVDLSLGDRASRILYEAAQKTWKIRQDRLGEVLVPFDDFSGLRAIDVSGLPQGTWMMLGFDGVGTKVEVAERMNQHDTIAFDLLAMVCDDAVIRGAEPVLVGSILDVSRLAQRSPARGEFLEQIRQIAHGYTAAALEAEVAIVNGELAEMGSRVQGYSDFSYNWGAAVLWFGHQDRMLTGKKVQPGESIIALAEEGFRSNGLSLVRRTLEEHYGEHWHETRWQGTLLGQGVLAPSRIYTRAIVEMTGGYTQTPTAQVHAAAHITGGGIPEKLARALRPSGCGAHLEAPLPPPPLMLHCQELARISDKEAYKTWHMGHGMLIITPQPGPVLEIAQKHRIPAQLIGQTTQEKGIHIRSQGCQSPHSLLSFFEEHR